MGAAEPTRTLVGRERHQAELAAVMDAAVAAGRGEAVLVSGEAGIGKTRLCQSAAEAARASGMAVAWASCWQSAAVPAYWPWAQILDQLGAGGGSAGAGKAWAELLEPAAAGPSTDDAGADPERARLRLFEAVAAALARAAAQRASLVVVDDLQWADPPSLRMLSFVAPRLHTIPLVLLAARRQEGRPAAGPLEEVAGELARHGRHLRLGGLSPEELTVLVEALAGASPGTRAASELHRRTGGNPLFARELVRLLEARGELGALAGQVGSGSVPPVPDTLRGVLAGRLAQLSAPARAILDVAAVVSDEFGIDVIEAVTATGRHQILEAVGDAVAAGVVVETGPGRWAFAHALIRAAVYDGLGVARRIRLHERVGDALEGLQAGGHRVPVAALAHHYMKAAPAGGAAKAAAYAVQAGEAAMAALAYEEAARLLADARAAIELDPTAGDPVPVLLALGEAASAAGDRPSARQAYLEAADLARRSGRADDLADAALGLGGGSGIEVALFDQAQIDLLREALGRLGAIAAAAHTPAGGESRHRVLRSRVTARLSVALSLAAPLEERLALSEEAVALVRPGSSASERAALASALAAHCDAIAGPADAERRAAESGEIVALATALDDRPMEMLGRRLRLVALLEMGDMAAVDAEIDAFALVAARLRQPLYDWYVPLWKGMRALMHGRIDDAGRLGREAADAGARVSSDNARLLTVTLEWFRLRESGRGADAWEYMRGMVGQDVGLLAVWQKVAEALLHAERGARDEARGLLDQVWPHAIQAAPVDSEWLAVMAQLTAAVASIGAHPVAAWAYDQILPHRGRFIVDGIGAVCHGSAERQLGVLAACLGRQREAAGHIEAALDANRRAGAALLVARTLLDGGRALGHTRWLDEAARAYRELGIYQMAQAAEVGTTAPPGAEGAANRFRREGDVWAVTWRGETVRLRHVKGMADLARLLARPGRELAAADLVAGREGAEVVAAGGDLGELIDDRARAAYQARLAALQAELDEADAAGDPARSARAAAEREALLTQLAAASGLGGRPRPAGGAGERARTAATWRIRDAIGRVEAAHPDLGRHLRRSVRTGTYCSYHPTEPTDWDA